MRKVFILFLCFAAINASAQHWDIHIAGGLNTAKLIPLAGSTQPSANIKYGFARAGGYFSPELRFAPSEHSAVSLSYEFAQLTVGVTNSFPGSRDQNNDNIALHQLLMGYHTKTSIFHDRLSVGASVKMGFAYGKMVGMSGSSSSMGGFGNQVSSSYSERLTGFEAMPGSWSPVSKIEIAVGPKVPYTRIGDRITTTAGVSICWKNMYNDYSKYYYSMSNNTSTRAGVVEYQGLPLQLQFGVNYRLFRFGKSNSSI